MPADILAAWDEIDELGAIISLDHRIYFDPRAFAADNQAPTTEEFELDENAIRDWGVRCSRLRLRIKEESKSLMREY